MKKANILSPCAGFLIIGFVGLLRINSGNSNNRIDFPCDCGPLGLTQLTLNKLVDVKSFGNDRLVECQAWFLLTVSDAGLIGAGHIPRPGEVSLAHNGVLFLDELPEFKKHALEGLHQPIDDLTVTIPHHFLQKFPQIHC